MLASVKMNYPIVDGGDITIRTPFRITVCGPSGSGKTEWISRFIRHNELIIGGKFDLIMYVYGENQPLFEKIKNENPGIIWCDGFCKETITNTLNVEGLKKLLIVDDLLQEVANDPYFHTFYVRRSHHWNVSILFTTQYLHQKGLRIVNLNTTHYVLFKTVRDKTPVRRVALESFPNNWRKFMEIYSHATRCVYIYIYTRP